MSVGVPALDSDHRCLVRIINLLMEVEQGADVRSTIETVLETLAMYARYHFAREERLMEACGFPASRFHCDEHEGFTRFVRQLRARLAGRDDPAIARELLDYLTEWLCHHILIQDMAYKPYVRRHRDEQDDVYPSMISGAELSCRLAAAESDRG